MAGGRPREFDEAQLIADLKQYIDDNDDPQIVGFCVQQKMASSTFYKRAKSVPQLVDIIKSAHDKSQQYIVACGMSGLTPSGFACFRLKQPVFGWTDKQEIQHSGGVDMQFSDKSDEQIAKAIQDELAKRSE